MSAAGWIPQCKVLLIMNLRYNRDRIYVPSTELALFHFMEELVSVISLPNKSHTHTLFYYLPLFNRVEVLQEHELCSLLYPQHLDGRPAHSRSSESISWPEWMNAQPFLTGGKASLSRGTSKNSKRGKVWSYFPARKCSGSIIVGGLWGVFQSLGCVRARPLEQREVGKQVGGLGGPAGRTRWQMGRDKVESGPSGFSQVSGSNKWRVIH